MKFTNEELEMALEQTEKKTKQTKKEIEKDDGMTRKEKMWLVGTALVSAGVGAGVTHVVHSRKKKNMGERTQASAFDGGEELE